MILEQAILPQHQIVISAGLAGVVSLSLFVKDRLPIVACLLNHHRKYHGHRPVSSLLDQCHALITIQVACGVIVSVTVFSVAGEAPHSSATRGVA
ncbi:ribosome-associated GTPase 1 [Fusarium oxysporum f. sp. albedinis]|nr:ribosome-associated GTPase 1 [Fusarium oxysporum f. sp. albedinis]